jgi:hypothetical protein
MDEAIAIQTRVGCGRPALMRMIFQLVGLQSNGSSIVRIPSCLTVVYVCAFGLDAGLCKAIATGTFDVQNNAVIYTGQRLQARHIVSTGSLILEKPLALPACTGETIP